MNELIKIENRGGKETVNARELHEFLEIGRDYSTWIKQRMDKYGFIENIDYVIVKSIPQNGGIVIDYYISIDMAKELSMVENNEKGKQARQYFIECEKRLNKPLTLEEMTLQVITGMTERVKLLESKIETDKPKVDFYNAVTGSNDTIDMSEVAKVLNMGIGRNKIFEVLREKKILNDKNIPYQKYVDCGYFRIIESSYTKPDGSNCIQLKTIVFQKGVDFIRKQLI